MKCIILKLKNQTFLKKNGNYMYFVYSKSREYTGLLHSQQLCRNNSGLPDSGADNPKYRNMILLNQPEISCFLFVTLSVFWKI